MAAIAPVTVNAPETQAWTGQRVPYFVELRAPGSFEGTAGFDLPQLPGTTIIKIGRPVVSSQEIDGESWFVQRHEFALFSQRPGRLDVPAFSVRFAAREGFTGPAEDVRAQTPAWHVEIRRPPGSDAVGFLITTTSYEVSQTWDPAPGLVAVGALLERTVEQRAQEVPGMALPPVPTAAPEGVRVYRGTAEAIDRLERGDFIGERRDTVRYLLTDSGTVTLPALEYVWWNPVTRELRSKTLPSVTLDVVTAPTAPWRAGESSMARGVWIASSIAALLMGAGIANRRRLLARLRRTLQKHYPPERAAARTLLRACRAHHPDAAEAAWRTWRNTQPSSFDPGAALHGAVVDLRRLRFGRHTTHPWRGDALRRAFSDHAASHRAQPRDTRASSLPELNP